MDIKHTLDRIASGDTLSADESETAFEHLMSGDATPGQIGAFLMGLRVRGETVDEIVGGVRTMRAKALPVVAPVDAIDTCGTGGDAKGTYNISTAVAFVVAACGVPVAKHGNKALSSKSGSAEVLEHLGVKLSASPEQISKCIKDAGIGFMMAPFHHSAMKHVGPVRQELGTRTIFNLMGPLSNPAGAKRQLVGVFSKAWVEPLAQVLKSLGSETVWVVHGSDGLDEIALTGPTKVAELRGGSISVREITPADAGLATCQLEQLVGGDPAHNAEKLSNLLEGEVGPYRDIVLLNAAAALMIADKASTLKSGAELAASAIESGKAKLALEKLVSVSNEG